MDGFEQFKPKILGFLCNWCSYAGADLAGVSRLQYPPTLRIIRVMCSGRIDPTIVLEALANGVDGVLVAGCHFGDCHYIAGNYQAEKKLKVARKLLEETSLNSKRLRLEWISASEGIKFAETIAEFTEQIKTLGPNIVDEKLRMELNAAKDAITRSRLRTIVGKESELTESGNVYGDKCLPDEFEDLLNVSVREEYIRAKILQVIGTSPLSVLEIADRIEVTPKKVLRYITRLTGKGLVKMDRIENRSPYYIAVPETVEVGGSLS